MKKIIAFLSIVLLFTLVVSPPAFSNMPGGVDELCFVQDNAVVVIAPETSEFTAIPEIMVCPSSDPVVIGYSEDVGNHFKSAIANCFATYPMIQVMTLVEIPLIINTESSTINFVNNLNERMVLGAGLNKGFIFI